MLDEDNYQYVYIFRSCVAPTYEYEGAVMSNMGETGPIELDIGRPVYCKSNKFETEKYFIMLAERFDTSLAILEPRITEVGSQATSCIQNLQ